VTRILGERGLRAGLRFSQLAHLELHQAERDGQRGGQTGGEPHGLLVRGGRLFVFVQARERAGQLALHLEGARVLLDQASERDEGFCVLPLKAQLVGTLELLMCADPVLRVGPPLPIARRGRLGEVAQRFQLLRQVGIHVARFREAGGIAVQLLLHRLRGRCVAEERIGGLGRIPADLVELGLGAVDVMMARVHE
jgi:hypothetical protein